MLSESLNANPEIRKPPSQDHSGEMLTLEIRADFGKLRRFNHLWSGCLQHLERLPRLWTDHNHDVGDYGCENHSDRANSLDKPYSEAQVDNGRQDAKECLKSNLASRCKQTRFVVHNCTDHHPSTHRDNQRLPGDRRS